MGHRLRFAEGGFCDWGVTLACSDGAKAGFIDEGGNKYVHANGPVITRQNEEEKARNNTRRRRTQSPTPLRADDIGNAHHDTYRGRSWDANRPVGRDAGESEECKSRLSRATEAEAPAAMQRLGEARPQHLGIGDNSEYEATASPKRPRTRPATGETAHVARYACCRLPSLREKERRSLNSRLALAGTPSGEHGGDGRRVDKEDDVDQVT